MLKTWDLAGFAAIAPPKQQDKEQQLKVENSAKSLKSDHKKISIDWSSSSL